ncbi:MAG: VWA domain-containing protein [Acidobacteria bacterium]|nr:VWA domain-containing protein [Acidobacteriota bacterium]
MGNRHRHTFLSMVLLLAGSLFCLPAVYAQDDDVIKVDASAVVVNASVTDASGRAVDGLKQLQFKVFEDGVEQKISSFSAEDTPFAAVILIDTSGSMEERVSLARSAAIEFLNGLRGDDYAEIYNFDSKVRQVQDFSNQRDLRDAIFDLRANGTTVLNDAIYQAAADLSKRPEQRRAILVLSDGADTASKKNFDKALKAALSINAMIYTVDMSPVDKPAAERNDGVGALKSFAEKTGGRFIATPGGPTMRNAFKTICEELGQQYTLTYEPANTKKDGKWHAIEVRISRPNLTIRTRKGYNAPRQ